MIHRALMLAALVLHAAGCKEEPTIIITFAPQDGSVKPVDLARPVDLSRAPDLAPVTKTAGDPCKKDADCVLEKADCCGCNSGGKAAAIGRARSSAYRKEMESKCEGTMCPAIMSNDPTCAMKVACVEGRCALAPGKSAAGPARPKGK